jgi:hypothetical protein
MSAIGARYPIKVKSTFLPKRSFVTDKCAAKIFIKLLLNPDPTKRPTALEAYNNHVSHCLVRLEVASLTIWECPVVDRA